MSSLSDITTHTRASSATYIDADGILQTAAINEPRVGHHIWNGSAWVDEGYLHESEARTNLILDSETIEQKDVYVTPQAYTLSFQSGQQLRSEISETLAVNAVDVFVYDTTKDSDVGAWATSFPQVMTIVAEATSVKIYNGTDAALPLHTTLDFTGYTVKALTATSGVLSVATTAGLATFNLADGDTTVALDYTTSTTPAIINNTVNDVAMTVLPDAPIDPATGLPVPTIAVATNGGTSIVQDDGTVDSITDRNLYYVSSVSFDNANRLYLTHRSDNATNGAVYRIDDVKDASGLGSWSQGDVSYGFTQFSSGASSISLGGVSSTSLAQLYEGVVGLSDGFSVRSLEANNFLSLVQADYNDQSKDAVCYVSSTYNTGWMNGAIKGAFLSDTDDTDLVGSGELVTNGDFATDSDWTKGAGWTIAGGVANNASGSGGSITQLVSGLIAGSVYAVSVDINTFVSGGSSIQLVFGASTGEATTTPPDTLTNYFVATSGGQNVSVFVGSLATAEIDNISVKLADADRSVNNNGLIVNGTVTRTPVATGADLVGYDCSTGYLYRDFAAEFSGSDTFCLMGWHYGDPDKSGNFFNWYETVGGGTSTAFLNGYIDATTGAYRLVWQGRASLLPNTTPSISGRWALVALVFSANTVKYYLDGLLVSTASGVPTADLHALRIQPSGGNKNALLRISATAPTAEQIAKIYEDEKVLFQENAQATLYGSSDAVTALAHDDTTNLLHVGTSAGRSVFDGLRRIDNTTDAVTTAISASGGFILEQ